MGLRASYLLVGLALITLTVPVARADDQTLLGSKLQVKDPKPGMDATKRKLAAQAKEPSSPDTIDGDPTVTGGTITFFVNGTTPSEETYAVPQGTDPGTGLDFWQPKGSGYGYKDRAGTNGPVSSVKISKSGSGTFSLKIKVSARYAPVGVVPPFLGTDACVRFDIAGGDSYHVLFPPVPDSEIKSNTGLKFDIRSALVEGLCPSPTTTTTTTTSSTTTSSTTTSSTTTSSTTTSSTTTSSTTTSSTTTSSTTTSTTSTTTTSTTTTTIPPLTGPAFPPDGGTVGFSFSGAPSPGSPGGTNVHFTGFVPNTSWTELYWGPSSASLPTAGLDGATHSLTLSGIVGTVSTWAGTTGWTDTSTSTFYPSVPIELRITITGLGGTPWVLSTSIPELDPGVGTGIGAVVDNSASALDFTANVQFLADIPTDGIGNFIALNSVPAGGGTNSSFAGGFYSRVGP